MSADASLPTIFSPDTLVRKGLCPVTKARGQNEVVESHSIYYEQHGNGPKKLVLIMGLNSSSFAWLEQVDYFAKAGNGKYSVLVFDNRGVGNSSTPRGPYSTRGMAEDIIVLLDMLKWTGPRELHVVGVSLGGMVSQELSLLIGDRIASLSLVVTTPGSPFIWNNFCPWKGTVSLARLTFMKDWDKKVPIILGMLFPEEWLDAAVEGESSERTNRVVQTAVYLRRIALTRPQNLIGALSQMVSGLLHNVSPERLHTIAATVPKVLILTGDQDHLIAPRHSARLARAMPEAEYIVWDNTGHGLAAQHPKRFNALLERVFEEGRQRSQ
ncbi:alpha/beta-hydrolase [Exidia glandulosa HHB12029]|uniref:Alpha/beta-hydrolase n=1 Tax=Exidia glandulosa HHB12029 TaxID=1314781 RepID=A0A166APX8_EXIGL|nr:alpha/beta-hydrolase [Exidia glandulosa HHB12029]